MQAIESKKPADCPYLSTIKKHVLDFDFQKVCSLTLAHTNIYCCLICGRYFQGRSGKTPAYQHSIQFSHHVFINMQNSKVYCLPDDYEVDSHTLSDIKFNLKPVFNEQLLNKLESFGNRFYSIDAKQYIPGVVGMNNLTKSDYASSVIYLMNSIDQIRRFFLLSDSLKHPLLAQFSLLLKKIWNHKSFKGIVSPHDFLQLVSDLSNKKFKIGHQSDPLNFLLWLIDSFSKTSKKQKEAFNFQKLFKGKLKISIIKGIRDSYEYESAPSKVDDIPFTILKLEFPEKGIFNKSQNQISILSLLEKYMGKVGEKNSEGLRYAKITQFPLYLILVYKRFKFNGYTMEKDSTELIYQDKLELIVSSIKVKYWLKAQICHEGDYEKGCYRSIFRINKHWFNIQNLSAGLIPIEQVELSQPLLQVFQIQRE